MKRIVMTLFAQMLMPFMALATTWYVDGTNGSDSYSGKNQSTAKKTIQSAIDVSSDGDIIFVEAGTYAPIVTENKAVTIRGVSGAASTIIDGDGSAPCTVLCESMEKKATVATVVCGFTLQNGYVSGEWRGGAATGGTFRNCIIKNNVGYGYGAAGGCVASVVQNCLVVGNRYSTSGGWGGGALANCGDVYNCTIANNVGYGVWDGVQCNCIIYGNTSDVYVSSGNGGHNNYCLTATGISTGTGNIIGDPKFVDSANGDYRLAAGSPCVDAGNNSYVRSDTDLDGKARIVNGTVDIGCYEFCTMPTTLYVNGTTGSDSNSGLSSSSAKATIQAAIDVAGEGDTILVAAGTYAKIATANKPIRIVSESGAAQTVIKGDGIGYGADLHLGSAPYTNTVLHGFSVIDGSGGVFGGTVVNCIIRNNGGIGLSMVLESIV